MSEQRKNKRFEVTFPIELILAGSRPTSTRVETRNMRSGGVLFTSDSEIEIGDAIEYLITLPPMNGSTDRVRLRCMGKVMRTEDRHMADTRRPFAIAATLERYEFIRSKV